MCIVAHCYIYIVTYDLMQILVHNSVSLVLFFREIMNIYLI